MKQRNRWIILVASCFMAICAGLVYLWSVFVNPVCAERGWDPVTVANMGGIMSGCFSGGSVVGGLVLPKIGSRKAGILGGMMLGLGILLSTLFDSIIAMYALYGVVASLGAGIIYNVGIFTNAQWFPDKRGLVVGIFLGVFGLANAVFPVPVSGMLNALGVTTTMRILGVIFLVVPVGASIGFLSMPPAGYAPGNTGAKQTAAPKQVHSVTVAEALKTRDFWQLLFTVSVAVWAFTFINSYTTLFVEDMGLTAAVALTCVSIGGVGQAVGRFGFGLLCDVTSPKKAFYISMLCSLIPCVFAPFIKNGAILPFMFFLMTAGYGGRGAIYPSLFMEIFGPKYSSGIYSLACLGCIVVPMIAPVVTGAIYRGTGSYTPAFLLAAVVCVLVVLPVVFLSRKTPSQKKAEAVAE